LAKLVAAKCPTCGAGVKVPAGAEWITCSYCQTSAFISRAKATTASPPPAAAGAPVINIDESSTLGGRILLAGLVVAALGGGYTWYRYNAMLEGIGFLGVPMPFDVNSDGIEDVIISSVDTANGDVLLLALEANSGAVLWESELGEALGDNLALTGDSVVVIGPSTFRSFDARTGEQRFSKPLPERVKAVCEAGERWFFLTEDKAVHALDTSSGALSRSKEDVLIPNTSSHPACIPASNSGMGGYGRLVRDDGRGPYLDVTGVTIYKLLVLGDGTQPAFALGQRKGGSAIPVVAGVRDGIALWQRSLPLSNPLNAKDKEAIGATIAGRRGYAAYERNDAKGFTLTGFVLSSGDRVWETHVPRNNDSGTVRLGANETHVFAEARGALHAFSADDGQLLWSRGHGFVH
jgi:outer membrane protein assembly factor BamB